MKRKTGLHKKVSSIFGDIALPENPASSVLNSQDDDSKKDDRSSPDMRIPGLESPISKPLHQYHKPAGEPASRIQPNRNGPRQGEALTEEQEYAAEQRKKLCIVIGLAVVFAVVLFFQFYKPNKSGKDVDPSAGTEIPVEAVAFGESSIDWVSPEAWTDYVRDPMVYRENEARLFQVENKAKGPLSFESFVQGADGKFMALIGTEILYVGEEIDGWTVEEIQPDFVKLENAEGEKLELKIKDREL